MARRPSRRDDAVTTEPVSDYDADDQFVGGMDLSTGLAIFTTLFILFGIGWIYQVGLVGMYDVGKVDGDPGYYRGRDSRLADDAPLPDDEDMGDEDMGGEDMGGEGDGGDEGGDEGGDGSGDEGDGGDEGGDGGGDDEEWD